MKTLMLLRHGKSDWDAGIARDHDRVLAPRGIRSARRVGAAMSRSDLAPDRVISSSAVRARATAELALEAGGWDCTLEVTERLYATDVPGALSVIQEQDTGERLLLVGHEPTWSSLASALIGGGRLAMVTAGWVVIDLAAQSWNDVRPGTGELRLFVVPRWLKKIDG